MLSSPPNSSFPLSTSQEVAAFDAPTNFTSSGGFSNYFPAPSYQQDTLSKYFYNNPSPYPTYDYNSSDHASIGANGGRFNRLGRGKSFFLRNVDTSGSAPVAQHGFRSISWEGFDDLSLHHQKHSGSFRCLIEAPPYALRSAMYPFPPAPTGLNQRILTISSSANPSPLLRYPRRLRPGLQLHWFVTPLDTLAVLLTFANPSNSGVVDGCLINKGAGTSASTPVFATVIHRINNERMAAGKGPVGFINPVLYANPQVLNDVVEGRNVGCESDGFEAVSGWDPVTGLGTPNFERMRALFMELP